jgi:hypothetical protein
MDCVTPSHRTPIPHGESLDIYQLLDHPNAKLELGNAQPHKAAKWAYAPRKPVLGRSRPDLEYLDAQITKGERRPSPMKSRSVKARRSQHTVETSEFPPVQVLQHGAFGVATSKPSRPARPRRQQGTRIMQVVD